MKIIVYAILGAIGGLLIASRVGVAPQYAAIYVLLGWIAGMLVAMFWWRKAVEELETVEESNPTGIYLANIIGLLWGGFVGAISQDITTGLYFGVLFALLTAQIVLKSIGRELYIVVGMGLGMVIGGMAGMFLLGRLLQSFGRVLITHGIDLAMCCLFGMLIFGCLGGWLGKLLTSFSKNLVRYVRFGFGILMGILGTSLAGLATGLLVASGLNYMRWIMFTNTGLGVCAMVGAGIGGVSGIFVGLWLARTMEKQSNETP